jgi:DNA ligase-associated metallophosphoesterase
LKPVSQKLSPVIPGRRAAASPESILPGGDGGFRVRRFAPSGNDGESAIAVAGVDLLPDLSGALYWPEEGLLVVADLHLEKGSAFAARGMLLPPYDSAATLARLAAVVGRYAPRMIVALGDSFHDGGGPARLCAEDRAKLAALQRGRDWVWIAGNHDPDPAENVGGIFAEILACGPIAFRHEPTVGTCDGEIAGHLHPSARVSQRGRTIARRCFATDGRRLVLPAFGAYCGGLNIRDRAFLAVFGALAFTAHLIGDRRLYAFSAARCL